MTLKEENALLRETLEAATFKLQLYRSACGRQDVGGMEYTALTKLIARAVLKQPAPVTNGTLNSEAK